MERGLHGLKTRRDADFIFLSVGGVNFYYLGCYCVVIPLASYISIFLLAEGENFILLIYNSKCSCLRNYAYFCTAQTKF